MYINQNLGPSKRGVYFLHLPFGGRIFFAFLRGAFCDPGLEAVKFAKKPNFITETVGAFCVVLRASPAKSRNGGVEGCLRRAQKMFWAIFQKNPISLNDPQMVNAKNKPPVFTGLSCDSYENYAPPNIAIRRLRLLKKSPGLFRTRDS